MSFEKETLQAMLNLLDEEEMKPIERGNTFEVLLRDLPLWVKKPVFKPKSRRSKNDQIDSFFLFKGNSFLIEAKAQEKPMMAGSEKWKSYKDKIISRDGLGVIGVFASLYPVDKGLIEDSKLLNERGKHNFVLAGEFWSQLLNSSLTFGDILEFMVHEVRANYKPIPPKIRQLEEQLINRDAIKQLVIDSIHNINSLFLNRYEHDFHEQLYVKRHLDNLVEKQILNFRPTKLKQKVVKPEQINVIRDYSGVGKTTFAVNALRTIKSAVVLCISALDDELDKYLHNIFKDTETGTLIDKLIQIDQPLVIIIDSLDEVKNLTPKQIQVKSILKLISTANKQVSSLNYACYPVVVYFTVRDEYYRDWESLFEGTADHFYKKKISSFTGKELENALNNYYSVYSYRITNLDSIDSSSKDVLSIPINLEIFSKANKNKGNFTIKEIWESKILYEFFESKKNQFSKRNLGIAHEPYFYPILISVGSKLLKSESEFIDYQDFEKTLSMQSNLAFHVQNFWKAFISEQILMFVNGGENLVSFRYFRFWEFSIAYKITEDLRKRDAISDAAATISQVLSRKVISVYRVLENVKHLVNVLDVKESQLTLLREMLIKKDLFIKKHLSRDRSLISRGEKSTEESIHLAILAMSIEESSELVWDSFYILTAKNNSQPKSTIIEYFSIVWDCFNDISKRKKLLHKMHHLSLMTEETVVRKVISKMDPVIYEVLLGHAIESNSLKDFKELWTHLEMPSKLKFIKKSNKSEWSHVAYLEDVILNKKEYISGIDESEMISVKSEKNQVSKKRFNKLFVEKFLTEFEKSFASVAFNPTIDFDEVLSEVELKYIREEIFSAFLKVNNHEETTLVQELQKINKVQIIPIMITHGVIQLNRHELKELCEIIKFNTYYNNAVITSIALNSDLKIAKPIISKSIQVTPDPEQLGTLYLLKYALDLKKKELIVEMFENSREILALTSIKMNKPIGNRLNNITSVLNNALQHYRETAGYYVAALQVHKLDSLANKESVKKKIDSYDTFAETVHVNVIKILFPDIYDKFIKLHSS